MPRVYRENLRSGDGPFWAVVAWADKPERCIVPQLVFFTETDAEKACRKRNKHPNALHLGMKHEVARVLYDFAARHGFREAPATKESP